MDSGEAPRYTDTFRGENRVEAHSSRNNNTGDGVASIMVNDQLSPTASPHSHKV